MATRLRGLAPRFFTLTGDQEVPVIEHLPGIDAAWLQMLDMGVIPADPAFAIAAEERLLREQ
jgi:hypothetical protein